MRILKPGNRLSNSIKTIIAISLIISSFAIIEISTQLIDAADLTKPLSPGKNTITYRDITTENSPITISATSDRFANLSILANDVNANLDILSKDVTVVCAVSSAHPEAITSVPLTETDLSTGTFSGVITLHSSTTTSSNLEYNSGDEVELLYNPEGEDCLSFDAEVSSTDPLPLARVSAMVTDVAGTSPSYTFSDYIVSDDSTRSDAVCPISVVVEPVQLDFSPGTTASEIMMTISYENAALGDPALFPPHLLKMAHRTSEFAGFSVIDSTINFSNKTITNTEQPPNIEGQYVIGFETGCFGGGGGGLVRPSLVVNALAGIGSFGGAGIDGSPPKIALDELVKYSHLDIPLEIEQIVLNHNSEIPVSPMDIDSFENFDYPMIINDQGFVLGGFSNTIETQTLKTDTTNVIKFILYETSNIQHISFYTNLRDANSQIHQSDTQILYNDEQELQIKDPNGFFSDVSVTINDINENKKEAVFEITFAKEMDTSDIIIRSWDPYFNSFDTIIQNAIQVVPEIVVESPIPTFEEPVIEELQSQSIPIWIKNNAAWWSEQQISDSDFVAGIEYLITNGIINVPGVEVDANSESTEIPDWIKNNAGWWADSLITDEDFTEAMQWLVANGVIQI
jgi:hypothetical protein